MKTFKDIQFFLGTGDRLKSTTKFDNGFEVSIIAGEFAYSTPRENNTDPDFFSTFEVAILNEEGEFVTKDFFPDTEDDVIGWRTRTDIDNIMIKVQGGRKSLQDFDFAF